MAEFCARYGFLPDAAFPWPMFVAMAQRLVTFEARDLLDAISASMSGAAAGPFGGGGRKLQRTLKELEELAGRSSGTSRRGRTPINRDD